MSTDEQTITVAECKEQVKLMARRTALLYHAFASSLIEELGEEQGVRLIEKSIRSYGHACGQAIKDGILAKGLPLTPENFNLVRDLPDFGWEMSTVVDQQGEQSVITYCPLAAVWIQMGEAGRKLGRLYCFVDQAKQEAYNPEYQFLHLKNVLDGDPYCMFALRSSSDTKR
jgi:hypothetical protein